MATTITPSTLCEKYSITPEQLSAGTHIVLNGTEHAVIVESASVPGQSYKVIWNGQYRVLQCTAHNGEPCKASASGKQCYHKRVAMAVIELEKAEARREQAEIEAQEYYRFEQAMHELETILDKLDEIALESDERDALRSCGILV
jgi:hypothetical protein